MKASTVMGRRWHELGFNALEFSKLLKEQLPEMTDSIASSWQKFFSVFKGGDVSIPDIGSINADIASIASSLKTLAALKGVIWA